MHKPECDIYLKKEVSGTFSKILGDSVSVTIIDVANKANVSKSTASRVLAGDVYGVSERQGRRS